MPPQGWLEKPASLFAALLLSHCPFRGKSSIFHSYRLGLKIATMYSCWPPVEVELLLVLICQHSRCSHLLPGTLDFFPWRTEGASPALDFGLGHVTCFDQWDAARCVTSRGFNLPSCSCLCLPVAVPLPWEDSILSSPPVQGGGDTWGRPWLNCQPGVKVNWSQLTGISMADLETHQGA
jgi:hypothetical protein